MRAGSEGILLLIGFMIGAVTIIVVCETKFTRDTKVIELGCAYYDSTTGDFTLKEKEK